MKDPLGALVPGAEVDVMGAGDGPLRGLTFVAKDLFDIAGLVTGCGNPDWARTHEPARRDAWAVRAWLDAGGRLVGKAITDELAYSINGQNFHYGTPRNANAPGRIPGGSSSGSASAVAGGLADMALGTDTGGLHPGPRQLLRALRVAPQPRKDFARRRDAPGAQHGHRRLPRAGHGHPGARQRGAAAGDR